MALRTYRVRVAGAADEALVCGERCRIALKQLGSRFFTARGDAGDMLVTVVFDGAPAAELLREVKQALPSELRDRVAVTEQPDPAHEISAQLLEDKREGRAILPGALQAPEDLQAWEDFLSRARPRGLIELGTASGVFSRWLNRRVSWFKTIDVGKPTPRTPGFVRLDLWERPEEVRDLISRAPRPFVLYCDNGDKPREVETFAPDLRVGDFLAVHDLGTEIFERDIPPGFSERLTFGLTGFYEKTV